MIKKIVMLLAICNAGNLFGQLPTDFNVESIESKHLKNIRQLTFGGDNAEAYFSFDGKNLSLQSNNSAWGLHCDQIFNMQIDAAKDSAYRPPLISTGKGRTTCSFFMPDNKEILFASISIKIAVDVNTLLTDAICNGVFFVIISPFRLLA